MTTPPFEAHFTLRSLAPRMVAWVLAAGVCVVLGLPAGPLKGDPLPVRLIAWLASVALLTTFIADVRRLRSTAPVMRIDENGVVWRRWSAELIPWSEIVSLHAIHLGSARFVGLVLARPERFPSKTLLGRTARVNRFLTGCNIALEVEGTDRRYEELVAALHEHVPPRA